MLFLDKSVTQLMYCIIGGLDFTLISGTIYIIVTQSQAKMKIYKYVQLNIMLSSLLFDLSACFGAVTFVPPYPAIVSFSLVRMSLLQLQCYAVSARVLARQRQSVYLACFSLCIHSIFLSTYYRLYTLSFGNSKFALQLGARLLPALYLSIVPNVCLSWAIYLDGTPEYTAAMISKIPEFYELRNEMIIIFDVHGVYVKAFVLFVTVFIICYGTAMLTMNMVLLAWLQQQKKTLSKSALAFHNQMILTLFLQGAITLTCACLPWCGALLAALGVESVPQHLSALCTLYSSVHSLPNCLLLVATTTPYREFVARAARRNVHSNSLGPLTSPGSRVLAL